jgi:general stress protein 26
MENSSTFALATSVDKAPNVRIITFCHDTQKKGVVYFPTLKQSPKTVEISQNNIVAFTTIPNGSEGIVRVKNATVQKSALTVDDIKDSIVKKFPGFTGMVASVGHLLEVYEIHFNEAVVTADHSNIGKVNF